MVVTRERESFVPVYMCISIDFSLGAVAWTRIAEAGVYVAWERREANKKG